MKINYFITTLILIATSFLSSCNNKNTNELETLKGHVVWGHEVRTFKPCGSNQTFWVADDSGKLKDAYNTYTLKDKDVYQSIYAELEVTYKGKANEGFPANYDGVYEVLNTKETRAAQDDDCE